MSLSIVNLIICERAFFLFVKIMMSAYDVDDTNM